MNLVELLTHCELFDLFTDTPQNERANKREELMWYQIVFISSELSRFADFTGRAVSLPCCFTHLVYGWG